MTKAFPEISKISYEGPKSKNPLAFKYYDADEVVEGKAMREHLRFSVAYWHTFRGRGSDMFGAPSINRPWDDNSESLENAKRRVRAAFEFIEKLGAPFYAFHDRDVAPEGATLGETNKNLDAVAKVLKEEQERYRHSFALGHGQSFFASAFRARGRDQLQCRCVRLRRRPGQEGDRGDA